MAEEIIRIYPNDNMSFNIDNLGDTNINDIVQFELSLEKEGKQIYKDTFDLDVEPGNNYWYFLEPDQNLTNGEYIYNITGKAKKAVNGLKKGADIAHAQKIFNIYDNPEYVEPKEYKPLEVEDKDGDVTITGENFVAKFSRVFGGLVSLEYNGNEYLESKPAITFWRPLTDTELNLGYNFGNAQWLAATIGQQYLPEKYYFEKTGESYKLVFVYHYPIPGGLENAVTYIVNPNGTIDVETIYGGLATVDIMPTYALEFKLSKNLDAFRYYGYGPEENYIDTTEGLDLGVYESTVRKNFKKNARPQETGNRTGVRWAEVYNSKTGEGIKFSSNLGLIEFNALPFNTLEIEGATNPDELSRVSVTNVRIAGKVSGLGTGDFIEDWAKVDAGEQIDLKFSISPVEIPLKKKTTKKAATKEEPKEIKLSKKSYKPGKTSKVADKLQVIQNKLTKKSYKPGKTSKVADKLQVIQSKLTKKSYKPGKTSKVADKEKVLAAAETAKTAPKKEEKAPAKKPAAKRTRKTTKKTSK